MPATALRRLALVPLLLAAGCARPPEPVREDILVFGSPASIEIRGAEPESARRAVATAAERLARFGRDWHAWEPGELTTINAAIANGRDIPVSSSIRGLLERSRRFRTQSDGLFDPALGGLIALWGFHTGDFPIRSPAPDEATLSAWLAQSPSLDDIALDDGVLRSSNPAVQLDFGGIAEGVAAEEVARTLSEYGLRHALISLGGDVLALGEADGRPWRVGIRDPYGEADAVLAGVELSGREALFTSGGYNKFREAPSGARWPHLLDPRTGRPVTGVTAVSVLHPDPVLADVVATTLFIGGPARFAELLKRFDVHCALLLTDENEMMVTAAMASRLELLRRPVELGAPLDTGSGDCAG